MHSPPPPILQGVETPADPSLCSEHNPRGAQGPDPGAETLLPRVPALTLEVCVLDSARRLEQGLDQAGPSLQSGAL